MNAEPVLPDSVPEVPAGAAHPRPWTPAAAMEPVPPLAPPPARPGAGTPVATVPRPDAAPGPMRTLVTVAAVAVAIAALVVLVILLGR
ncbi:MAG: hypothetical protein ACRENL_13145 [Candidatus Dormibacteria bacterium]